MTQTQVTETSYDDQLGDTAAEQTRPVAKSRLRALIMFTVFMLGSLIVCYLLFDELTYFFKSPQARDLGRAEEVTSNTLSHGDFISIEGIARDMCIRAKVMFDQVRYLYLLGSDLATRIIVQLPDPKHSACEGALEKKFTGRIISMDKSSRYHNVVEYYRSHFASAPDSGPIYVLEDGVFPRQAWYFPVVLAGLFGLALLNLVLLLRKGRQKQVDKGVTHDEHTDL